jgi:ubiquinone/menaquinone biosynthesis C-methylase UbiE
MEIRTFQCLLCPQCGGKGELLYANMMDRLFGVPGIWSLRSCPNKACGLCWLDPVPIEEDLHLLYKNYYTHGLDDSRPSFLARLWSFLYASYLAVTWIPSAFLGLTKARRQIQKMFLDDLKPGKLLDIGCGNGIFLHRMHKLGWNVTGVDFDAKAIEYAKVRYSADMTFLSTDLSGAKFPDNYFDAIATNHVIEHVPDPVALLKEARRILKVGGRLVVVTPNIQSFGHEKFQDCWIGLDAPRHLQIFSLDALQQCAREAGFDAVKTSTSAAHADGFMGLSFRFKEAKANADNSAGMNPQFNFMRGLRSLMLQYLEQRQLRHDAGRGDEAILICHK